MPATLAPLLRTDTRLDLTLDSRYNAQSPATPRAYKPISKLGEPAHTGRELKRTESIGKSRPLKSTVSIFGQVLHQPGGDALEVIREDDNVDLDFDTQKKPRRVDAYVGAWLDQTRLAKTESAFEITPNIEMVIEDGPHIEFWDANPHLCAKLTGCIRLSRKTMNTLVDGRAVEIELRGIAVTASTVENPQRCENNHFDSNNPEWQVGGLSGGHQVEGRAVYFGNGATELNRARVEEFSIPFHIEFPLGLLHARRDRVVAIGASAIFGSTGTSKPDVVRRVESGVLRLTISNLCSNDVMVPSRR